MESNTVNALDLLKDFKTGLTFDGRKKVLDDNKELKSEFIIEKSNQEEYTKNKLISPILFHLFPSSSIITERHFKLYGKLRKVDYCVRNEIKKRHFLIEAKPFNADLDKLDDENSAINQLTNLFKNNLKIADEFKFGVATDGFNWIFIHRDGRILKRLNIEGNFSEILEFLSGEEVILLEKIEEKISSKFYLWYRSLLYGGRYRDNNNTSKNISYKDSLVENIFGVSDDIAKESIAQVVFNRMIFIKFLQSKKIVPSTLLTYLIELDDDIINSKLKQLMFKVFNIPKDKRINIDSQFESIPYLNGNLFERNDYELKFPDYSVKSMNLKYVIHFLNSFEFISKEEILEENSLDPQILGYIFERAMTAEDRKGTGAFYTPKYITKMIAEETVYRLVIEKVNHILKDNEEELIDNIDSYYELDKKTLGKIFNELTLNLRICDNACGSGAFLLAVAEILFDLLSNNSKLLGLKNLYNDITVKKLILNNILFGVDINPNAIEITKLRLWLWLVSSYSGKYIEPLPNIEYNIRKGNTLVGFYDIKEYYDQLLTLDDYLTGSSENIQLKKLLKRKSKLIDKYKDPYIINRVKTKKEIEDISRRIKAFLNKGYFEKNLKKYVEKAMDVSSFIKELNPFHWPLEFEEVFTKKRAGFDIIVGNPPYINLEKLTDLQKISLKKYECYSGKTDILYYFYNRSLQLLNKGGFLGLITSRYFVEATFAKKLRKYLINNSTFLKILDLSNIEVFRNIGIHNLLFFIKKELVEDYNVFYKPISYLDEIYNDKNGIYLDKREFTEDAWVLGSIEEIKLFKKIKSCNSDLLGEISEIEQGQKTGKNSVYSVNEELINKYKFEKKFIKKLIKNSQIHPYFIEDKDLYLIYASDDLKPNDAPNIFKYLSEHKNDLESRAEAKDGIIEWYRLQRPRKQELFDADEKIIVPYRAKYNKFGYDNSQCYALTETYIIVVTNPKYSIKFIIGILNSKLMNFFYRLIGRRKGDMFEYFVQPLTKIPIAQASEEQQRKVIKFVEKIMEKFFLIRTLTDKKEADKLLHEIITLKEEIDKIVFDLYELNEEEIKLIDELVEY